MPLDDEMEWLYSVFCISLVYQVGRIPFNQQIRNFENTLDQITGSLGADDVAEAIAKSIFFVGMGSNDYLNNYLMPNYATRNQYNGQQFATLLIQEYNRQLNVRFIWFRALLVRLVHCLFAPLLNSYTLTDPLQSWGPEVCTCRAGKYGLHSKHPSSKSD